ncbi:MAG: TonB C-terminal domain-containing protein, partial [Chthoniobacterales bacterium]
TPKATPKQTPKDPPKATAVDSQEVRKATAATSSNTGNQQSKNSGQGSSSASTGEGKANEFTWYHELIHDRFYSQWTQPTSVMESNTSFICSVQIRIERDGRISNFKIIKNSGNIVMDESVSAIQDKVKRIDPLPDGLGSNGSYDIVINFELD